MHKVKVFLLILKVKFIKDNGIMIRLMVLVYIHIQMEQLMRDTGRTIFKTEREQKNGLMALILVDNTSKERRMD
jgi:hypothetical protein